MMLFCKYGVDPSDPSIGFVLASYDDDKVPGGDPHPGCLAMSYAGQIEVLGRYAKDPSHFNAPRLTVALAQASKLSELSDDCGAAITGCFVSSALGSANLYSSSDEDQRNLTAAAGAAIMGQSKAGWTAALKCAAAGQKATRQAHTAAQVHAVLGDWVAFKDGLTTKLDALKAKALAASTADAVAAVFWG